VPAELIGRWRVDDKRRIRCRRLVEVGGAHCVLWCSWCAEPSPDVASLGDQAIVHHSYYHQEPEAIAYVGDAIFRYQGASFKFDAQDQGNLPAPGKVETSLTLASEPDCIEGVPKGSPDGTRILEFRACWYQSNEPGGVTLTDTAGSYRTFIADGFGPDWNPTAN